MEKYLDTNLSAKERAQDLLSKMSLEEKMGQVNCLFPWGDNWENAGKRSRSRNRRGQHT